MGHNTQLPTCGMLSGKLSGKWRVERHENLDGPGDVWCAFHNENDIEETHRHFPTWGEAMDYADRMACTTPPRGNKFWHVRRRGNDYEITRLKHGFACQWLHVAPADLQPLADLLQAAHRHEKKGEL